MRKELLNFLGLSQRSYYTWQKEKHPHIIEIVNDVFKTKEDILFFNLFWELPYSYSDSHKKTYNEKSYKEKLCEILGIKPSSYYHWQTGKRENIIKLFETIFKNIDDLDYWIQKNKSKNYSIKLNQLFIEILKQVAESPTIGRKTEFENVRVRIVRDYLLFYKYDQKQIKVLTVWDGNREEKTLKIE